VLAKYRDAYSGNDEVGDGRENPTCPALSLNLSEFVFFTSFL
jgi:hypothetical protein